MINEETLMHLAEASNELWNKLIENCVTMRKFYGLSVVAMAQACQVSPELIQLFEDGEFRASMLLLDYQVLFGHIFMDNDKPLFEGETN